MSSEQTLEIHLPDPGREQSTGEGTADATAAGNTDATVDATTRGPRRGTTRGRTGRPRGRPRGSGRGRARGGRATAGGGATSPEPESESEHGSHSDEARPAPTTTRATRAAARQQLRQGGGAETTGEARYKQRMDETQDHQSTSDISSARRYLKSQVSLPTGSDLDGLTRLVGHDYPAVMGMAGWSRELLEDEVEMAWQDSGEKASIDAGIPTTKGSQLMATFKACLYLFRCSPLAIVSPAYNLFYDASSEDSPIWSVRFSMALAKLITHPIWGGSKLRLTRAIQLAVLCRTDNRRTWTMPVEEESLVINRIAQQFMTDHRLESPLDCVGWAFTSARDVSRSHPQAEFLYHLASICSHSQQRVNDDRYLVRTSDLTNIIEAIETLRFGRAFTFSEPKVDYTYNVYLSARAGNPAPVGVAQMLELYRQSWQHEKRRAMRIERGLRGDDEAMIPAPLPMQPTVMVAEGVTNDDDEDIFGEAEAGTAQAQASTQPAGGGEGPDPVQNLVEADDNDEDMGFGFFDDANASPLPSQRESSDLGDDAADQEVDGTNVGGQKKDPAQKAAHDGSCEPDEVAAEAAEAAAKSGEPQVDEPDTGEPKVPQDSSLEVDFFLPLAIEEGRRESAGEEGEQDAQEAERKSRAGSWVSSLRPTPSEEGTPAVTPERLGLEVGATPEGPGVGMTPGRPGAATTAGKRPSESDQVDSTRTPKRARMLGD